MSRCFCGLARPESGPCRHGAPPEADRRHLQAQTVKRRANDAQARQRTGYLGHAEVQNAAAKLAPVEAKHRAFWTRGKNRRKAARR